MIISNYRMMDPSYPRCGTVSHQSTGLAKPGPQQQTLCRMLAEKKNILTI